MVLLQVRMSLNLRYFYVTTGSNSWSYNPHLQSGWLNRRVVQQVFKGLVVVVRHSDMLCNSHLEFECPNREFYTSSEVVEDAVTTLHNLGSLIVNFNKKILASFKFSIWIHVSCIGTLANSILGIAASGSKVHPGG